MQQYVWDPADSWNHLLWNNSGLSSTILWSLTSFQPSACLCLQSAVALWLICVFEIIHNVYWPHARVWLFQTPVLTSSFSFSTSSCKSILSVPQEWNHGSSPAYHAFYETTKMSVHVCTSSWAPLLNTFLCRIRGTWHIPRLSRRVPKHNSWAEHFSFLANENRGNWTQTERGGTLEFHRLTCGSEQFPEVPNILEMRGWFLDSLNFILYAVNTE